MSALPLNSIEIILAVWVLVSILLYAYLDPCRATLLAMLGGWAFLPNQPISPEMLLIGKQGISPLHAMAVPDSTWFNKATVIGIGCLLGALLFARKPILSLRPRWFDLPLALFLLAPFANWLANRSSIGQPLFQTSYLAVAWGVPYLLGRAYFSEPASLLRFAQAWVIAGLLYIPLGLAEFFADHFWYTWLYGRHPYRCADRWLAYRPLGFFEHGNQFGTWMATTAVAAVWIWSLNPSGSQSSSSGRYHYLGIAALSLVTLCLLWQSLSSIALMLLCFLPLFAKRIHINARVVLASIAGSAGIAIASFSWAISHFGAWELRMKVRSFFRALGKGSFTWRLARMEENFSQLAQRPWFGWGIANWSGKNSAGTFTNPVNLSLWFLQWGMFGLFGLFALAGLLLLPLLRALHRLRQTDWNKWPASPAAIAAILLVLNVAELAMNSLLILPILLACGGLSGWACRASDDR